MWCGSVLPWIAYEYCCWVCVQRNGVKVELDAVKAQLEKVNEALSRPLDEAHSYETDIKKVRCCDLDAM